VAGGGRLAQGVFLSLRSSVDLKKNIALGESVLYVLGCVWFSSVISGYVSGSQVGSQVNTCTGYDLRNTTVFTHELEYP
jgi:hypothetical protein